VNTHPDHPDHPGADMEDTGLSALYRQGATQAPRLGLDQRILDQAQAAISPRTGSEALSEPRGWHWLRRGFWPQSRNWLPRWPWNWSGRWNWRQAAIPLSSVAGLLLTVGLVFRVLEEQSAVPGINGMAPRPLAEDQLFQSTQSFPPAKAEGEVAAKRALEEASALSAAARLPGPLSPAPALAIGNQAQDQAENQPKDNERRPANPKTDRDGDSHLKSHITDEMPQVIDEMPQADPERWLEDIRQMWSSGQRAEAIRQLTAFRQVHPQYPLPEDLAPHMGAE
jgi:hypothetical protein